jgi:sugar phosphate isomerase/epimerase
LSIYISSSVKENIEDVVKLANELGVNIEICRFADSHILDGNLDAEVKRFYDALKDFQGKLSLHGTFFDLNPVSKDSRITEITIYRYTQSLNIAKALNAKTIVFHTGYNGLVKSKVYHDMFINNQILLWKEFIKQFEDADITVVLENTYEDTTEVIASAVDSVNSKYLKACIDTGHVNINSSLSVDEWITELGESLHHMHLHNNSGHFDEHASLLSGTMDFKKILNHLSQNNLNPNLVIEIFQEKPALESFELVKNQLNIQPSRM